MGHKKRYLIKRGHRKTFLIKSHLSKKRRGLSSRIRCIIYYKQVRTELVCPIDCCSNAQNKQGNSQKNACHENDNVNKIRTPFSSKKAFSDSVWRSQSLSVAFSIATLSSTHTQHFNEPKNNTKQRCPRKEQSTLCLIQKEGFIEPESSTETSNQKMPALKLNK